MLPPYRGDMDKEVEDGFLEWIERFEELAQLYTWGDAVKLFQLKLRMEGPARAFCRDCPGADHRDYASLRTALTKRFTPVRLGAARSGVFQQQRQKPRESVDQYAQELRRLSREPTPRLSTVEKQQKQWVSRYLLTSLS